MSSIYEVFDTDRSAEETGIRLNYGEFSITIARAGGANKRFSKMLERRLEPHQRAIQAGLMDDDRARKILAEVFAETVVLGWDNVPDREGKLIVFSKEACAKLLLELPELFDDLREQATKASNFRQAQREATSQD